MPHVSSSGGDDLGSTDEVKVFKDEGDGEDEKRSSENLTEEKSSLIDLTESEVRRRPTHTRAAKQKAVGLLLGRLVYSSVASPGKTVHQPTRAITTLRQRGCGAPPDGYRLLADDNIHSRFPPKFFNPFAHFSSPFMVLSRRDIQLFTRLFS